MQPVLHTLFYTLFLAVWERLYIIMAVLRFSKEINDIKTTTANTVVRWISRGSGSSSSSSMMNENHRYWEYEIPDNESAVKAAASSACYDTTFRIWATAETASKSSANTGSVGWTNNPYLWYQQQCSCSSYQYQTLFYRILHWGKQIILKVGRSYYALPILLLLFTLCLGILIGYVIGYRRGSSHYHERQHQPRDQKTSKNVAINSSGIFSFLIRWHTMVWSILERIQMGICFFFYLRRQKSRSLLEMRDGITHKRMIDSSTQCKPVVLNKPSETNYDVCRTNDVEEKERIARGDLKSDNETKCESGLSQKELPHHIAVVMDGNRRYGLQQYNDPVMGHWDGSKKLVQFAKWCVAEQIQELTVYAFSTENWSRSTHEVSALMNIIIKHCEELRIEAMAKQISIHIMSTDIESIPVHVREVLYQLEKDTFHNNPTLRMNICLSYGSRGEIVQACRSIVTEYQNGNWTSLLQITEASITQKLLIGSSPLSNHNDMNIHHSNNNLSHPPDIFIRTSGEVRLSNFLLWQMAYTELFFLQKNWPELNKDDFLDVLRSYANCRQRRYGR